MAGHLVAWANVCAASALSLEIDLCKRRGGDGGRRIDSSSSFGEPSGVAFVRLPCALHEVRKPSDRLVV